MNNKTLSLLRDLLRLIQRYGTQEFEQLAETLSNTETRERAVALLRGVVKIAADAGTSKRGTVGNAPSSQETVTIGDHASARVVNSTSYPTLRDINEELTRLGVQVPTNGFKSRVNAARAVKRHIASLNPSAARDFLAELRPSVEETGGELEEWSKIIMNRKV